MDGQVRNIAKHGPRGRGENPLNHGELNENPTLLKMKPKCAITPTVKGQINTILPIKRVRIRNGFYLERLTRRLVEISAPKAP